MANLYKKVIDLKAAANEVLMGKPEVINKALCCIFAGGHLLIEDIPGVGKTTLVKLLSKLMGLTTNRAQCTNDLLPADIIGGNILSPKTGKMEFQQGPIFSQLLIADELNRATPRTQSACLQAMEERQVSVDGVTYDLPNPFILIATQNPLESIGTFPLPESQLDRFLMRIKVGYPDRDIERSIIKDKNRPQLVNIKPIISASEINQIQELVSKVHISDSLLDYVQDIVDQSRSMGGGLSTRAVLDIVSAIKSWAFLANREYGIPDDLTDIIHDLTVHRMGKNEPHSNSNIIMHNILDQVSAP